MNSNQEIIQPSETSFHIKSAKFLCRPCNRQFSCVNPENGRAACPRCNNYSNLMIENAQQSPIQNNQSQTSNLNNSQTTNQQSQSQNQQTRNIHFVRQTIYRPGQTIVIETFSPEVQFNAQNTQQNQQNQQTNQSGFGLGNLFGFGGLSNLFGGSNQPSNQNSNPSDLFGNANQQQQQTQQNQQNQQNQQRQQGFFVSPFDMFFVPAPMMFFSNGEYERLIQEFLRNDPNNYGPAPASEQSINQLKEFEYGTSVCKNSECSVCQDEYKSGDKCLLLPCEHNYHKDCVVEWLKRHDSCPICRKPISLNKQQNSNRMEEEIPQQQAGF